MEVAGFHLVVDLLMEELPETPAAIFCDSKAALLILQRPASSILGVTLLSTWLAALRDAGCPASLHWIPAYVGIPGNKEADAQALSTHHIAFLLTTAVTAGDFTRHRLRRHLQACHLDKHVPELASTATPTVWSCVQGAFALASSEGWLLLDRGMSLPA